MRKTLLALLVTGVVVAKPTTAQLGVYIPPQCDIDTKHFLAKQAQQYVKAAAEARSDEDKVRALQDAFRTLNDAITRGEEGNPAIWYFFGRAYAIDEDFAGADSAFSKVEAMLPDCVDDTDTHRYNLWVPVYNEAVTALRAGDWATAKPNLIKANAVYHKEATVPFYLASIYAQDSEPDSGIVYFKEALNMLAPDTVVEGADTTLVWPDTTAAKRDMYNTAVFNTARLYHQKQNWDSAVVWYERYRTIEPDEMTTLQSLSGIYEMIGESDKAEELFEEMLSRADQLSSQDLFSTGVSLFQADRYEMAAEAFTKGLEKNPYFRDGVYNLGQSYFALANPLEEEPTEPTPEERAARTAWTVKMLGVAQRLVEVDPLNVASLQMLVQAYHLLGESDSTAAVIDQLNELDWEVVVTGFFQTDTGFDVTGNIQNLREEAIEFPGLTLHWINASGETVATDTVPGQTIDGQATLDFHFAPVGEGLAAWLYEPVSGT